MRFRKRLEDLRKAHQIVDKSWSRCIPTRASAQEISSFLASVDVDLACPLQEFRQRIFELDETRRLGAQLATLAETEGCVRDLAKAWIERRADFSSDRLRARLKDYDEKGLPDRFRSLVEGFAASVEMKRSNREAWNRLLEYRNWLAHGRRDAPPRTVLPIEAELDREIDAALNIFRAAVVK